MLNYLEQFNKLPKELREKISSPEAMRAISNLERKYEVGLAVVIMRVMVKDLAIIDLPVIFVTEFKLSLSNASQLANELKLNVFSSVADYLAISAKGSKPAPAKEEKKNKKENEEEKLVSALKKKINQESEEDIHDIFNKKIEEGIEQVIKENKLVLTEETKISFKLIMRTYLRSVRSKIDTREALDKFFIKIGLADREKILNNILKTGEEIKAKYHELELADKPDPLARLKNLIKGNNTREITAEADYNLASVIAGTVNNVNKVEKPLNTAIKSEQATVNSIKIPVKKGLSITGNLDVTHEIMPPTPVLIKRLQPEVYGTEKKIEENFNLPKVPAIEKLVKTLSPEKSKVTSLENKTNEKDTVEKTDKKPEIQVTIQEERDVKIRKAATVAGKKSLEEIRLVSKIMGPIDELRYLDIINFRRLADDPQEAVKKVKTKIKLLEKDGYDKMIEGVKAWRQNPINKLYLEMIMESFSKNVKLQEIISGRQSKKVDFLSQAEIDAIITLNTDLNF
ncbi:MAG: hypothetical protein MUF50_00550 [Planctomycetes bacterium]|jgi:hypothetical protein|nr:hypothetical protein [Planctomycetota bacterium]